MAGNAAREKLQITKEIIRRADKQVDIDVVQTKKDDTKKAAAKTVADITTARIIHETVTNTIYRDCKLSDAGLHDINELIGATNSTLAGTVTLPAVVKARRFLSWGNSKSAD